MEQAFARPFPALTPAQRYHLDVFGYVVIEETLTADEVSRQLEALQRLQRDLEAAGEGVVTEILDQADKSERRQLIRKAIAVRHASKSALDDLSDEQRQALQAFALQAIIDRGKAGGGNS